LSKAGQRLLELLEQKGAAFHRLFFRLTLNEHASEELLQDLFVKLYKSGKCSEIENLYAYAYRCAVNLVTDYYRRNKRPVVSLEKIEETLPAPDCPLSEVIKREEIDRLLIAVSRLKWNLKQIIVMRYIEQQSFEEIGKTINKDAHQVRALCSKGIQKLRKLYDIDV
jgi:RNA polymerase sigma-70 factor (ECF subfamily)